MADMLRRAEISSLNRINFNSAFKNFMGGDKEFNLMKVFSQDNKKSMTDIQKFQMFKRDINGDLLTREYHNLDFLLNPSVKVMVDDLFIAKLLTGNCYQSLARLIKPIYFLDFKITNPEIINFVISTLNNNLEKNKYILNYLFLFRANDLDLSNFKELVTKVATFKNAPINKVEFYKFMLANFPNTFSKLSKLLQISLSEIEIVNEDLKEAYSFNEAFPFVNQIIKADTDLAALYTDLLLNIKESSHYMRAVGILSQTITRLFKAENAGHDLFIMSYAIDRKVVDELAKSYFDLIFDKEEYKNVKLTWQNSWNTYQALLAGDLVDQKVLNDYKKLRMIYCDNDVILFEIDNVEVKYNYDFALFVQKIYENCIEQIDDTLGNDESPILTIQKKIKKFGSLVDKIEGLYLDEPKKGYQNVEKQKFRRFVTPLHNILKKPLRLFSSDSDKLSQFKKLFNQLEKNKDANPKPQDFTTIFDKLFSDVKEVSDLEQAKRLYFNFINDVQNQKNVEENLFYHIFKESTKENNEVSKLLIDFVLLNEAEQPDNKLRIKHDMLGSVRTYDYNKYNLSSYFSDKLPAHVYTNIIRDFGDKLSNLHLKILMTHFIRFSHAKEDFNQHVMSMLNRRKMMVTLIDFYYLVRNTEKYSEMFVVDFINILSEKNDTVIYVDTVFYDYIHVKSHVLPVDYILKALEKILKFNQRLFYTEVDTIQEFMAYTTKNQKLNAEIEDNLKMQFYTGLFKIAVNNRLVSLADEAYQNVENKQMLFVDENWHFLIKYLSINPKQNASIIQLFLQNKDSGELVNKITTELFESVINTLLKNMDTIGDSIKDWFEVLLNPFIGKRHINDKSLGAILQILSKIKNDWILSICLRKTLWTTNSMILSEKTLLYLKTLATNVNNSKTRDDIIRQIENHTSTIKVGSLKNRKEEIVEEEGDKVGDYFFLLHLKMVMHGIITSRFEYKSTDIHFFKPSRTHAPPRPPRDKRAYFYQILDPVLEEDEQKIAEITNDAKEILKKERDDDEIQHIYRNASWLEEVITQNYESVHEIASMNRAEAEQKYGKIKELSPNSSDNDQPKDKQLQGNKNQKNLAA